MADESYRAIQRLSVFPSAAPVLATQLVTLIKDIRRTLVNMNMQNHQKLDSIQRLVDAQAPPPGSDWERYGLS